MSSIQLSVVIMPQYHNPDLPPKTGPGGMLHFELLETACPSLETREASLYQSFTIPSIRCDPGVGKESVQA
jgi:hypothetical protein